MNTRELFVVYSVEHIDEAVAHAQSGKEVLTINLWAERELKRRGIEVRSYAQCREPFIDDGVLLAMAQSAAREWYRVPAMKFFEHKGISIGEALEPALEAYLLRLLQYRALFERILDVYQDVHLIVPYPRGPVSSAAGPLTYLEARVAVDAAAAVAHARGLGFSALGEIPQPPEQLAAPHSLVKSAAVALYNFVLWFAPRRTIKIYASESWSHIAPFVERMDDVELAFMERNELRAIPWREIWRHRIRFVHPHGAASVADVAHFRKAWGPAQTTLAQHPSLRAVGWTQLELALAYLVCTYAKRVVDDIDSIESILVRERPDKILLRVSVSRYQHHFFVLARVARRLGIPSIEIQHAGAFVDPRSVYSRLEADYLASYGPYVRGWYERMGVVGERIVPVGSPRFDRCIAARDDARTKGKKLLADAGLDMSRPALVSTVPEEGFGSLNDSYAIADLFHTIRTAQRRVPGLQIVLKFRAGHLTPDARALVDEIFDGEAVCMDRADLFALLCAADVAVCGNSTVIYEALLARIPLILYPWVAHLTYHTSMYEPAAPIVVRDEDFPAEVAHICADASYKTELIQRGQKFLEGYSFDGKASERLVALLRSRLTSVTP